MRIINERWDVEWDQTFKQLLWKLGKVIERKNNLYINKSHDKIKLQLIQNFKLHNKIN